MSVKLKAKPGKTFNALSADQQQQVLSPVSDVSPNAQPGSEDRVSKIHAMSIQLSNETSLDWKDSNGKRKYDGSGKEGSSKSKGKGKGTGSKCKGKGKVGSKGGDGAKAPAEGLCKVKGCTAKALLNYSVNKQEKYKMMCYDCNKKSDSGEELKLYSDKEWWTKAKRDEVYADKNGTRGSIRAYAGQNVAVTANGKP